MLYHYTSGQALQNITGNAELWAGLPEQMNDAQELRRALTWLNLVASQRELDARVENKKDESYNFNKWAADQSKHALDRGRWLDDNPKSYLISLSSEGDSLSQWRAYCPDNNGYCVGFPSALIMPAIDAAGAHFAPCIYNESDVERVVRELYDYHLTKWLAEVPEWAYATTVEGLKKDQHTHVESVTNAWQAMLTEMRLVGHFIKNPSFEAENEWRILFFDHETTSDDLKFVTGRGGVRAFLPFKFAEHVSRPMTAAPRPSLRIGPNSNVAGARFSATRLLEQLVGEGNADVFTTSSSYR